VNKFKTLKGVCLVAVTAMLPLSHAAMAEVSISGWINQGIQFWDDGEASDATALADNGTTLGDRLTISASSEVATGLTGGIEVIYEMGIFNASLVGSTDQDAWSNSNNYTSTVSLLSSNVFLSGGWGKVTFGTQSMPTDNIAVLEDPSLTLWSSISPIFHGNGFRIKNGSAGDLLTGSKAFGSQGGTTWGNFLNCFTAQGLRGPGVGIGIDCNGIYRTGVRYDLPAFAGVTVAIGYANDDVYDIAAKWKGDLGSMKASIALGYAVNNGQDPITAAAAATAGATAFAAGTLDSFDVIYFDESENFQLQAGLMHPATGLFGSIAYQHEETDIEAGIQADCDLDFGGLRPGGEACALTDDTDAWWIKVGIKKQWFSLGDTSIDFQYGQYNDQYGAVQAAYGATGSEVERIGVAVNQYLGSSMIIYGSWENLDLDVDCLAGSDCALADVYGNSEDLDTFTIGAVYFF